MGRAVGVPLGRLVGGARRQPFTRQPGELVESKEECPTTPKKVKGFVCFLSVNETLDPKKVKGFV